MLVSGDGASGKSDFPRLGHEPLLEFYVG
jgi:hypothetical protein